LTLIHRTTQKKKEKQTPVGVTVKIGVGEGIQVSRSGMAEEGVAVKS